MKGVVTAGGLGTRLYPLTIATNKHLLPVYDKPMVFYPIQTLVNAGITQILIKEVRDPQRFGVPVFNGKKEIIKIEEKPKKPGSKYAVTGLYLCDKTVFSKVRKLKPSKRGELEITDLNNLYLKDRKLTWSELKGYWSDAGTFESLFEVNKYWASKRK